MIEIPRTLVRQFRTVLRRTVMDQESRSAWPLVLCQADERGLTLQAGGNDITVRYREPDPRSPDSLAFRSSVLAEFEGKTDQLVTLENLAPGKGQARWSDGGVPRVTEFDTFTPDTVPALPTMSKRMGHVPAALLRALAEAAQTTSRDSTRFALARVQLRGKTGEVVATDGRQLLIQSGFAFPWPENILVPKLTALNNFDLSPEEQVGIGRANGNVTLRVGPWTFVLVADTTGRFAEIGAVIPNASSVVGRLQLDPEDAAILAAALAKLPGRESDAPVTLDLCGRVAVRARAEAQGPITEVMLSRSTVSGKPMRLCLNRRHLLRALKLGFTEAGAVAPDKPLVWRDQARLYLCMPLDQNECLPPGADVLNIASARENVAETSSPPDRRPTPMTGNATNGHPPDNSRPCDPRDRIGLEDLIGEAETLRTLLGDASTRTARLAAALKQHRRQARAVKAAVASLRQLEIER